LTSLERCVPRPLTFLSLVFYFRWVYKPEIPFFTIYRFSRSVCCFFFFLWILIIPCFYGLSVELSKTFLSSFFVRCTYLVRACRYFHSSIRIDISLFSQFLLIDGLRFVFIVDLVPFFSASRRLPDYFPPLTLSTFFSSFFPFLFPWSTLACGLYPLLAHFPPHLSRSVGCSWRSLQPPSWLFCVNSYS